MSKGSIANILQVIDTWQGENRAAYDAIKRIYDITEETAVMTMNPVVEKNMLKMFNTTDETVLETLKRQRVLIIYNKWSQEEIVYNPARARRPGSMAHSSQETVVVDKMAEDTASSCVFCQYEKFTAEDMFGRLHSQHCVSVANAFPFAGWHSMVLMDTHHPTQWTLDQLLDIFTLGMSWFEKTLSSGVNDIGTFPSMTWDTLPRAGGTQLHPHIHVSLTRRRYPGQMEVLRQACRQYHTAHPTRSYLDDMLLVHRQLALSVTHGRASAIATITPKKDNEVIVISDSANKDFFELIYYVTRVFVHDIGQHAFSAGIALPHGGGDGMGAVARMVPRGPISSHQSDASSLDFFMSPTIAVEPYHIIHFLRERLSTTLINGDAAPEN